MSGPGALRVRSRSLASHARGFRLNLTVFDFRGLNFSHPLVTPVFGLRSWFPVHSWAYAGLVLCCPCSDSGSLVPMRCPASIGRVLPRCRVPVSDCGALPGGGMGPIIGHLLVRCHASSVSYSAAPSWLLGWVTRAAWSAVWSGRATGHRSAESVPCEAGCAPCAVPVPPCWASSRMGGRRPRSRHALVDRSTLWVVFPGAS